MGWPHYLQWRLRLFMRRNGPMVLMVIGFAGILLLCLWRVTGLLFVSRSHDVEEEGAQHITRLPSIVVVEEHHEVLKYWYEAVLQDLLPKQGLTLVHIDAHSDMARPELLDEESFPTFRLPRNPSEVRMLMQANDVFIQGAMMTGLINRTIWIWPSWDDDNHDGDYEQFVTETGTTSIKSDSGDVIQCLCLCYKSEGNRTCDYYKHGESGEEIEESHCNIKSKYYFEEVRDTVAFDLLQKGGWMQPNEQILLDIDEDFFGVEEAMKIFFDEGFEWEFMRELNSELIVTFCPQTREAELNANRILVQIIAATIECQQKGEECDQEEDLDPKIQEIIEKFTTRFYTAEKNILFCPQYTHITERHLYRIQDHLSELNITQLKLLADVGFCRITTPKTYEENNEFRVCHGITVPGQIVVTLHTPSEEEVNSQMSFVEKIVRHAQLPKSKLTTICRSIRDGYCPKHFFRQIEDGVLQIASKNYQDTEHVTLFDEDLLGGKEGWFGSHRT